MITEQRQTRGEDLYPVPLGTLLPIAEPVTQYESVCKGTFREGCGRTYQVREYPWEGVAVQQTHGVCPECAQVEARILGDAALIEDVLEDVGIEPTLAVPHSRGRTALLEALATEIQDEREQRLVAWAVGLGLAVLAVAALIGVLDAWIGSMGPRF